MKTKDVILLLLISAIYTQCTKTADETDEISKPPTRPSVESPDSTSDPTTPDTTPGATTGDVNTVPAVYENGYANFHNARLTVNSLSVTVAPEFQYVVACLDGSDNPNLMGNGSVYTDILLHDDGAAYVKRHFDYSCSLLNGFNWYGPLIYHWDLEYSVVRQAGQPDEITISGTGRGSHIWEIPYDAWVRSEITFEFRGIQIEGTNSFEGNFALEERSPEEKYNLSLSGSAALSWKQEGE